MGPAESTGGGGDSDVGIRSGGVDITRAQEKKRAAEILKKEREEVQVGWGAVPCGVGRVDFVRQTVKNARRCSVVGEESALGLGIYARPTIA